MAREVGIKCQLHKERNLEEDYYICHVFHDDILIFDFVDHAVLIPVNTEIADSSDRFHVQDEILNLLSAWASTDRIARMT